MSSENTEQINSTEMVPLNIKEIDFSNKEEIDISNKEENVEEEEQKGYVENIVECLGDQDSKQKINISIACVLEVYRVLMGSFLTLFVPQSCGDKLCGLTENITTTDLYTASFSMNVITFACSMIMYMFEVKREVTMINYLHVNDDVPTDNDEVGKVLVKLPEKKKNQILALDKIYQKMSYITFVLFLVNSVLSGVVIYDHYLDNKTLTVFITNVLFMAGKLGDVYAITNTEENIFYSAYLKHRVQYNDVDPDQVVELLDDKEPEDNKETEDDKEPEDDKNPEEDKDSQV